MPTLAQWQNTWQTLGASPLIRLYNEVIAKYDESHRYYHNKQHLTECLEKFTELRHLSENPAAIELALWFHDAIYDPLRHDNEQLSAAWARSSVIESGHDEAIADRIYDLVLATQHNAKPKTTDAKIIVDVDLSILGAQPERFLEYEQQIRKEYAFVPEATFQLKRGEILHYFLNQPTIFNTLIFIDRYEQQARTNLAQALARL
jgi:predicted metal-dependent HD superfamily phosphohydrolase